MTHVEAEIIETARLVLEPLRIEHRRRSMAIVLADPQLHAFIGGAPATAQQLRSRYTRMLAGPGDPAECWCNWMIRMREDHQPDRHRPGDRPAPTPTACTPRSAG